MRFNEHFVSPAIANNEQQGF